MAVNDTLLLQVIGNCVGNQHIHGLHFRSNVANGTANDLINAWQAAAGAQYRAMFHTTTNPVQKIIARVVCGALPLAAPFEQIPLLAAQAGTRAAAGDQQPSFMACYVRLRTALAGRTRMGKFFLGGLMELDTAYNDIQGGYITIVNAYLAALTTAFITPGLTSDWRLVVHSRKLADVPGTQCQSSSEPVTTMTATSLATTMRSRKTGHGL